MNRLRSYLICMYADKLSVYHAVREKHGSFRWHHLNKTQRMTILAEAKANGCDSI